MIRTLILLISMAATSALTQTGSPRAVIPELNFDAGTVIRGDVIEHSFLVKNEGDTQLILGPFQPG